MDAGSIAKCGIELGFDSAIASSLAATIRVALQVITLAREKGQKPEITDTCGFYCYPLRKWNAGSAPYLTDNYLIINCFLWTDRPIPRPKPFLFNGL
jgi:hypothetical protein